MGTLPEKIPPDWRRIPQKKGSSAYSTFKVSTGSALAAFRAGIRDANKAPDDKTATTIARVQKSTNPIPKSQALRTWVSPTDAKIPKSIPVRVRAKPPFKISPTTWLPVAPRAMRIPISWRLWPTVWSMVA
jgi:hypothetical protein